MGWSVVVPQPLPPAAGPQSLVLHNVMPIFTFMGDYMLRRDDSYSLHVIQQTVDSIVPVIVQVCLPISPCSQASCPYSQSSHPNSQPSHLTHQSSWLTSLHTFTHTLTPHSLPTVTCHTDWQTASTTKDSLADASQVQAPSLPKANRRHYH